MPLPAKSAKPLIAGILILFAAAVNMIIGGSLVTGAGILGSMIGGIPGAGFITDLLVMMGAICLIMGIIQLIGAITAIQRKLWGLSLVAAIIALISFGPYFLSSIFGLIAIILLAMSKNEFR